MKNRRFYQSLHGRRLNTAALARAIGTSRSHLTEVLNNKPRHGKFTRRRLFVHLTEQEVRLLGWGSEYDLWRAEQKNRLKAMDTFAERLFHVEH